MANSTADGSVIIDVDMNVSDAEKELAYIGGWPTVCTPE